MGTNKDSMKPGDLILKKWTMYATKGGRMGILLEKHKSAIKVLLLDGRIKSSLEENWEVV